MDGRDAASGSILVADGQYGICVFNGDFPILPTIIVGNSRYCQIFGTQASGKADAVVSLGIDNGIPAACCIENVGIVTRTTVKYIVTGFPV